MKASTSIRALVAALALTSGGSAFAIACTTSGLGNGQVGDDFVGNASTDDATLSLNGGAAFDSTACHVSTLGNGGNTSGVLLQDAYSAFGDGVFSQIGKLENQLQTASGSFGNIDFTLTATGVVPAGKQGTWTLEWTGGPANLDIVLAIHSSNRAGSFLFDDVSLSTTGSGDGIWRIEWLNGGGQVPDYSNMTVWARQGSDDDIPGQLPLPGSAALLGLGLAGLGLMRRRKN